MLTWQGLNSARERIDREERELVTDLHVYVDETPPEDSHRRRVMPAMIPTARRGRTALLHVPSALSSGSIRMPYAMVLPLREDNSTRVLTHTMRPSIETEILGQRMSLLRAATIVGWTLLAAALVVVSMRPPHPTAAAAPPRAVEVLPPPAEIVSPPPAETVVAVTPLPTPKAPKHHGSRRPKAPVER